MNQFKTNLICSVIIAILAVGLSSCGGGSSSSSQSSSNNPVPAITSLSPSTAVDGAIAQTLTIAGDNFLSSSTVTYNAIAHTATFVSASQLTITLSATDQATAGNFPVVVTNPSPGGGPSNAMNVTVTATKPVAVTISPASAPVQVGGTQQFTAQVTNSTNGSVTWTVNSVAGGNSTVGKISAGGLYTAPATVPNPDTVTVTATSVADTTKSASATVTVTAAAGPLQISSLSANSINPLTPLTITGTGFDPANSAISVVLVSEAGNPTLTIPAFAATSTTVQIMVPPLPVTGTFSGDIVDLQVIQVDGGTLSTSNITTGLSVNALPALPSGATTGDLTLYFLQTALNVSSTLQSDAATKGWSALNTDLTQYNANINALITNVNFVRNNPGQSAAMTTSNGLTVALDQNALALSDQLIQAYVTQVASQIPSSFSPSFTRRTKRLASLRAHALPQSSTACPSSSGDPALDADYQLACAGQQYMQTYAAQEGQLLQVFGTLYYGFGTAVLGGYGSAAAAIAGWGPDALLALQVAAGAIGSYAGAAGTASAPPSPCDVIAGAGATVLDDAAKTGIGIFSAVLTYFQLDRDVSAIMNPSAGQTSCPGPLLSGPPANAPSGTTPINSYQTTNGTTTETTLAAPTTSQAEPTTVAVIPPPQVTTYTLTAGVASGDGSVESFPEGIFCGNTTCTASFPAGTSVTVTATPTSGESLISWSGACSGIGPCTVVMNSNESVSATFGPGQTYSGTFNQMFSGTFPDPNGDTYSASVSGTIILNITENSGGAISGSATVPANIGISVASCPIDNCSTLPFSETVTGTLSGTAQNFGFNAASSDQEDFTVTFTGSLNSDGTVTGTATFSSNFVGSSGSSSIETNLSVPAFSITLTGQ